MHPPFVPLNEILDVCPRVSLYSQVSIGYARERFFLLRTLLTRRKCGTRPPSCVKDTQWLSTSWGLLSKIKLRCGAHLCWDRFLSQNRK